MDVPNKRMINAKKITPSLHRWLERSLISFTALPPMDVLALLIWLFLIVTPAHFRLLISSGGLPHLGRGFSAFDAALRDALVTRQHSVNKTV